MEAPGRDKLEATRCATYLKALADPQRLRIVQCLQSGPMTVSDIAALLEIDLANASHHLRLMRAAELLSSQRDGKHIYYSLSADISRNPGGGPPSLDFGCCRIELSGD